MSKCSEAKSTLPFSQEIGKESQKSLEEAWTSKLQEAGPPYLDLSIKISEEGRRPLEDSSVKHKIEKFEKHRKRKAEESPKSPDSKPRVTKLARKKKVKRKLNQTQIMLASMNQGIMQEFKKINAKMQDNSEKLNKIEKKAEENSEKLVNLESKTESNEKRIEKLETEIPNQMKDQIGNAMKTIEEKMEEKLEQHIILLQAQIPIENPNITPTASQISPASTSASSGPPPGPPLAEFPALQAQAPAHRVQAPQGGPVVPLPLGQPRVQAQPQTDWAEMAAECLPLQPPPRTQRPRRKDFDNLEKEKINHELTIDEIDYEFEEAPKWVGVVMEEEDWLPYLYEDDRTLAWASILNSDVYFENRVCAIKGKIEVFAKIHTKDMLILDHYVTTTGQVVAWVKTTPNRVQEIIRRAATIRNDRFKTKIFVPKMARARKADIDKTLLDVKKTVPDLRYIIRNGKSDLQVLLRRGVHSRYMEYPIDELGSIAPLSPRQKNQVPDSPTKFDMDKDGFRRVPPSKKTVYRQVALGKDMMIAKITAFIDGFDQKKD